MTGRVWSELRRPLRAVPELEATLHRFDDTYARDKALYSTWLADAYLDAGEVEQAATVLIQSKWLCEGIASPRPTARINAVRERLMPYREVAAVAEILAETATSSTLTVVGGVQDAVYPPQVRP
jgi:hypothetical protein